MSKQADDRATRPKAEPLPAVGLKTNQGETVSKSVDVGATAEDDLPLHGVRVIDLTDGVAGSSTRLLAELGADVMLVEPPEGVASRRAHARHGDVGLPFLNSHANKQGVD